MRYSRRPARNMLPLTILPILFITQSYAIGLSPKVHHHISHFGDKVSSTTSDYYDSIHLPNPNYRFNYMFEQKRKHEHPLIEKVEEPIGKYMHYIPSTTTTTVATTKLQEYIEENRDNIPRIPKEEPKSLILELEAHDYHREDETKSTMPPVTPVAVSSRTRPEYSKTYWDSWKYIQSIFPSRSSASPITPKLKKKHHPHPHIPSHIREHHPHRHHSHPVHMSPTTTETPKKAADHLKHEHSKKPIHLSPSQNVSSIHRRLGHDHTHAPTEVSPVVHKPKHGTTHGLSRQHVYRGSYKFNQNNIYDVHTSSIPRSTLVPETQRMTITPPPMPTLSPWYDGYGK